MNKMGKVDIPIIEQPSDIEHPITSDIKSKMSDETIKVSEDFINENYFVYDIFGKKIYKDDYVLGPVVTYDIDKNLEGKEVKVLKYCQLFVGKVIDVYVKNGDDSHPLALVEFFYRGNKSNKARKTKPLEKYGEDLMKIEIEKKLEEL